MPRREATHTALAQHKPRKSWTFFRQQPSIDIRRDTGSSSSSSSLMQQRGTGSHLAPPSTLSAAHLSDQHSHSRLHSHYDLSSDSVTSQNVTHISSSLKLCCFNVRGLLSNSFYVKNLLSRFLPDFITITEHWLHD